MVLRANSAMARHAASRIDRVTAGQQVDANSRPFHDRSLWLSRHSVSQLDAKVAWFAAG